MDSLPMDAMEPMESMDAMEPMEQVESMEQAERSAILPSSEPHFSPGGKGPLLCCVAEVIGHMQTEAGGEWDHCLLLRDTRCRQIIVKIHENMKPMASMPAVDQSTGGSRGEAMRLLWTPIWYRCLCVLISRRCLCVLIWYRCLCVL